MTGNSEINTPLIAFWSSTSGNTKYFVEQLGFNAISIPSKINDEQLILDRPFILVTPTYGGGYIEGAVPKPVIRFLNTEQNRNNLLGVIAGGNTNFGTGYCLAGNIISTKCKVPFLYRFEIRGTPEDVLNVQQGINKIYDTTK